ncbi:DUF2231 domain-containing protein [Actinoplanes sp. NEAU-A12]|uniref:DUF2231 domain-containing protein n=1 Tax=Actinoplanes sandaracinus TaxID=3045177 RepID=A0ABT6WPY6_9ACTN|nr:DUF2231 domain-containing protein [Actinoplanes sandaracinus]MDI6101802.1 DUF2231 domain-containing protein [Actinoplanes sandaracinus]
MQSRLRLAGHGVQPLLLMFPLGLFWTAFVFDLATLLGAPAMIGTVAFWNLVAGLGGGVLAALAAVFDAVSADSPTAARIFCLALLLDVGVLIVFAVLALMRVRDPDRAVSASLLVVEAGGLAAAAFGAWFGGRFAHPRAPVADRRRPRPSPGPVTVTVTVTGDVMPRPAAGHRPHRQPHQPAAAPAPRNAAAHTHTHAVPVPPVPRLAAGTTLPPAPHLG